MFRPTNEKVGHVSSHPRKIFFPGTVVVRRNVAMEGKKEVNSGSVSGQLASGSGDRIRLLQVPGRLT